MRKTQPKGEIKMEQWGIFTTEKEVEDTVQLIKDAELDVFEVRKLTFLEKLNYCKGNITADIWIVMFYATKEEYDLLLEQNDLTSVF
jgi:hypothetical protein